MKKLIVITSLFVMLMLILPATALPSFEKLEKISSLEQEKVIITLHKTDGKERIEVYLSRETTELIRSNFKEVDIIELLPEEYKIRVLQIINKELNKMTSMSIEEFNNPVFNLLSKKKGIDKSDTLVDLAESLAINETYVNVLCTVKGVGLLLLFPPFIPITPILYAGLLILNTNGLMGMWNETADHAVMIPFVGLSLWLSGVTVIQGISGLVIAVKTDDPPE